MHIEVSYRDIAKTDSIERRIVETASKSLRRFSERLTRIEVHVGDHNGAKSGPDDKRCMIEARPARMQPVVVEAEGDDLHAVVADAVSKMRTALDRRFDKRVSRRVASQPHRRVA